MPRRSALLIVAVRCTVGRTAAATTACHRYGDPTWRAPTWRAPTWRPPTWLARNFARLLYYAQLLRQPRAIDVANSSTGLLVSFHTEARRIAHLLWSHLPPAQRRTCKLPAAACVRFASMQQQRTTRCAARTGWRCGGVRPLWVSLAEALQRSDCVSAQRYRHVVLSVVCCAAMWHRPTAFLRRRTCRRSHTPTARSARLTYE
jgi:hypothetical protein